MMNFGLSEEQELLQSSARDFLERECPPARVREIASDAAGLSGALESATAAMGWPGLLVPSSHGGLGLGALDVALVLAELGRSAAPGPFLFSSVLATWALVRAGDARQKRAWLPKLARGEAIATIAWQEEEGRFDPPSIALRARKAGRGWELRGRKLYVPYAAQADLWIVVARTASQPEKGVSLFLVERPEKGASVEEIETVDRTRRFHALELRGVRVGPDATLGRPGTTAALLDELRDLAAIALAADSLGGAERVLEMAVAYAKTREQFGRPIGSFQAVKHLAAEMVAKIEPSRSLLWYAAHTFDSNAKERGRTASMAKARLGEVYSWAANTAVQIHGGIGFTWEHDIHFWFKRAKWNELAFGDSSAHRERVAALGGY